MKRTQIRTDNLTTKTRGKVLQSTAKSCKAAHE